MPKVLGGIDCCVCLQQGPLTLCLTKVLTSAVIDVVRAAFGMWAQAAMWSMVPGCSGAVGSGLGETRGWKAFPRPSAEGRIGRIPESLQGRTFANHRLDLTPELQVSLRTKYWLSLHVCCHKNARFVKFNDTHDYSTCIICWLLQWRQKSLVEANRSRINNGHINRFLYNEFTDLPILLTLSVLSRFALIPATPLQKWLSQSFCPHKTRDWTDWN